jgi:hypothetical protein
MSATTFITGGTYHPDFSKRPLFSSKNQVKIPKIYVDGDTRAVLDFIMSH